MVRPACVAAVFLLLAAACGNGEPPGGEATPSLAPPTQVGTPTPVLETGSPPPGKPPVEASDLEDLYRDPLAALGLVLTDRGGLIDRSDGGYEKSADGDHLALYLEPAAGERTMQEFVDGIVLATRVFVPDVFERWPGLASMDVCQEPLGDLQRERDPPPVSQVEVSRDQADAIDWDSVTVADIVSGARADPPRLRLIVSEELERSEEFLRAAG